MIKRLLFFIYLAVSLFQLSAFAQDDEIENGEVAPTEVTQKVSSDDIEKLSDARKSRSEAALLKVASEILAKDYKNTQALNALAVHYAEAKKYGLSKVILRRALKDNPDEPALHNNLGVIYLIENEPRLALDSFRKSIQSRSSYKIGATNLASIYLEHRDYARSLAPLEEAYKATRSDLSRGESFAVEIANNYGVALMGVGENARAEEVFEKLLDSNTRLMAPYVNYAILLTDVLKKKKDAMRVLNKLKLMTEEREILKQAQELEKRAQ